MIPSAPARVAALLAGDVQMIEGVPTADMAKLSKDGRVDLASAVSNRIIYLHMDSGREKNSPFVTTVRRQADGGQSTARSEGTQSDQQDGRS